MIKFCTYLDCSPSLLYAASFINYLGENLYLFTYVSSSLLSDILAGVASPYPVGQLTCTTDVPAYWPSPGKGDTAKCLWSVFTAWCRTTVGLTNSEW